MKIRILIAGIMGALMLFGFLAAADYSADQPLTNVEHGMTYGDLVFVYSEVDVYENLDSINENTMSQDLELIIPDDATIVTAKLYNYVTYSTAENRDMSEPGDTAEARMTFNGAEVLCQYPEGLADPLDVSNPVDYGNGVIQYWDTKGQDYTSKSYDCPSGTFVWDVTDLIDGSDTYTATITNADRTPTEGMNILYGNEAFATYGFSLLVVYDIEPEGPQPIHRYYSISEGADILKGDDWYETPEDATASAFFQGGVPMVKKADTAKLTTVVVSTEKGLNSIFFNDAYLGQCTQVTDQSIGVDTFDVKPYLLNHGNYAEIQDSGDYVVASNAFLVTEYFVE